MKLVWSASVALGENSSSFSQITLKQTNDGFGEWQIAGHVDVNYAECNIYYWSPRVVFDLNRIRPILSIFSQKAESVLGQ